MATEAIPVTITDLRPEHWPEVARIYEEGIATGEATFETSVPSWEDWDGSHLAAHRFVAVDGDGGCVGWVAVSPVSDRCVYGGVVENSVYVADEARGQGVGSALLERLVASTEAAGMWTIQTGIFPENERERPPPRASRLRGRRPPQAARKAQRRLARRAPAGAAKRGRRLTPGRGIR